MEVILIPVCNRPPAIIDAEDFEKKILWVHRSGHSYELRICDYRWSDTGTRGRISPAINISRGGRGFAVRLHRLIAMAKPGEIVDHKNFNTLDNRKSNLRILTPRESTIWRRPLKRSSTYRGVHWDRTIGKWRAQTSANRTRIHIGVFDKEEDAAMAYDAIAPSLFGDFAQLNFPHT
jgi:hypothetical protein